MIRRGIHIVCLLMLLLSTGIGSNARGQQAVQADARLDTNSIRIGEQIRLDLSIIAPAEAKIQFPIPGDTLPGLEIVRRDPIDTLPDPQGRSVTYRQRFYLTRFDSGFAVLQPFLFVVADPGTGRIDSLSTEAQLISVRSLQIDTAQAFKDIKPILDVPFTWRDALPYILVSLALILLAYLFYRYWKKRKLKPTPEPRKIVPAIPAHLRALNALNKIEAEKLWQQGKIKEYHTRVTDVLRFYLEERFGIPAPEMTTDELIERMSRKSIDPRSVELLRSVLVLADLVKFAKANPLPDEHEQLLRECREIIDLNRPVETTELNANEEVKS